MKQAGYNLVEICVCLSLLAMSASGVMALLTQISKQDLRVQIQAEHALIEQTETARALNTVIPQSTETFTITTTSPTLQYRRINLHWFSPPQLPHDKTVTIYR
tara:strand:+ start:587 stop:895 length:309 start_codon:yes stop_codon:yes gene_type:complete